MEKPLFWRLIRHLSEYRSGILLAILFNVLTAIFTVLSAPLISPFLELLFLDEGLVPFSGPGSEWLAEERWFRRLFLGFIAEHGRMEALAWVCLTILAVFFFKNLCRYLSLYFTAPVRNGMVSDLRQQLFERALTLSPAFFTRERRGDLISRAVADVQEVETSILQVLETIFREPLIIAGSLILMVYLDPALTGLVLVLLGFTTFVIGGIGKKLKQGSLEVQSGLGRIATRWEETLGGLKTVQAYRAEGYAASLFEADNQAYRQRMTRLLRRRDLSSPLAEFLGIAVVTLLLWIGARQVFSIQTEAGTFFAFLFAFFNVIDPAKSFSRAYFDVRKGLAALERIWEITDRIPDIPSPEKPVFFPGFQHEISFSGVHFTYSGAKKPALQDIHLRVAKGKKVALVGPSGAGKTTLCDLLLRFHDVGAGAICLDGTDIRQIKLEVLRAQFAYVGQETTLFHGTVFSNLTLGQKDCPKEDVLEAARMAKAHDFIQDLPQGYDTLLGERGLTLSGGQRQRIALARAILTNAPIVILDEATSAIDSLTEQLIRDQTFHIFQDKTILIIAHRERSVQHADEIVVLQGGFIVEQGSPAALLEQHGAFRRWMHRQSG